MEYAAWIAASFVALVMTFCLFGVAATLVERSHKRYAIDRLHRMRGRRAYRRRVRSEAARWRTRRVAAHGLAQDWSTN